MVEELVQFDQDREVHTEIAWKSQKSPIVRAVKSPNKRDVSPPRQDLIRNKSHLRSRRTSGLLLRLQRLHNPLQAPLKQLHTNLTLTVINRHEHNNHKIHERLLHSQIVTHARKSARLRLPGVWTLFWGREMAEKRRGEERIVDLQ